MKKLLFFILLNLIASGGTLFAQDENKNKPNVAILIFDGVQIIDYTGPYEVLGSWGRRNVFTVAEKAEPVTTAMGMRVIPSYSFENHPKPDVLVIPGGGNSTPGSKGRGVGAQLDNKNVIGWIKKHFKDARYVMSVCNGAFLLARAGLLENIDATTTAGMINDLKVFSPSTNVVFDKRFVHNGKIITTAGLSSGIDGALHLVETMDGLGWAKIIAISIEYDWRPKSDYARASLADMNIPGDIYREFFNSAEPWDLAGDTKEWEETWIVKSNDTPAILREKIGKVWASAPGWSRISSNGSKAFLLTKEIEGTKTWNGYIRVEPISARKESLLLTIKIAKVALRED